MAFRCNARANTQPISVLPLTLRAAPPGRAERRARRPPLHDDAITLAPGDSVALYADGITDAHGADRRRPTGACSFLAPGVSG